MDKQVPPASERELPGVATREERLQRARSVTENVLERHGTNVIAIGVYGSTGRGSDEPYSDVEMAVVVRKPVAPERYEYYFEGWKTEVEFVEAHELLAQLHDIDITWPIRGGQYLNVIEMHDPDGFWGTARERATVIPDVLFEEGLREALVGEWLEHVAKYRNARLRRDEGFMRWAAWQLAWDAVRLVGLANRFIYASRATAFPESRSLSIRPAGYEPLIDLFESGELTDISRLDRLCEGLAEGMLGLAVRLDVPLEVEERPI